MAIDFYFMHESPPCRAVEMVARHLGVTLNPKYVDLSKGEHLSEEFVKLNPQHCVPTIVDNGFVLWESRSIITYLANKYAPTSDLYPLDPTKRAKIDQLLNFDLGTLYKAEGQYLMPILSCKQLEAEKEEAFQSALQLLDSFVSKTKYITGETLTLADISLLASLSFAEACEYDLSPYEKVTKWVDRLKKELPYYLEINEEPLKRFTEYMRMKKKMTEEESK